MVNETLYHCPNAHLFRCLSYAGIRPEGCDVLEIGCVDNQFADLHEFKRRGANVYGVDIQSPKDQPIFETRVCDIGHQELPFDQKFDIIYLIDIIYYLTDQEIAFFVSNVRSRLKKNGFLVIQIIESDAQIDETANPIRYNLTNKVKSELVKNMFKEKFTYQLDHTIKISNEAVLRKTQYLVYHV